MTYDPIPPDADSLAAGLEHALEVGEAAELRDVAAAEEGQHWLRFYVWARDNGFAGETLPVSGTALAAWLASALLDLDLDIGVVADVLAAIREVHEREGHAEHLRALGA